MEPPTPLNTTIFLMPVDLVGEGVEEVVARSRDALGVGAVALAVLYHASRDLLPHNPQYRVHQSAGGACFRVEPALFSAEVPPPPIIPVAQGRDLLAELCVSAGKRGMPVDAWVVYLHEDASQLSDFEGCVVNAFGDRYPRLRCPSSPRTRRYARAVTENVARYPIRSILAEGLHWYPFEHGDHHERTQLAATPRSAHLLSVCFCASCEAAAAAHGLDSRRVAERCRNEIDAEISGLAGVPGGVLLEEGLLEAYLDLRTRAVSTLVAECADIAAAQRKQFVFIDLSAGRAGWSDGNSSGPLGVDAAPELGIDVASLARTVPLAVAIYTADPARVSLELSAYREVVGSGDLRVILRPMPPDVRSDHELPDKLNRIREKGVSDVAFYQYGLARRVDLARIPLALAAGREPGHAGVA
ncbi:MAG: hypothetical protein QOF10_1776 [Kribbellaceae bacterium]|nr:hypothetical protein [Kribbellaceae bacterium]